EQDIPLRWVPERMKRYLYEKDGNRRKLLADRYEFFLYRQLRNGVEGGDIFCRDSVRFRSINDDLIDEELWRTSKEELIAKAGLDILCQPIGKHLAELKERLETRLSEVNRRIATGANTHFKLKGNGRWTLEYPGDDEETNHPFFDQLPQDRYQQRSALRGPTIPVHGRIHASPWPLCQTITRQGRFNCEPGRLGHEHRHSKDGRDI